MLDVQAQSDIRNLPINQVGVRDLRYPVRVMDRSAGFQTTTASISMGVSLPAHVRGTHMSRFLEVLNVHHRELTTRTLPGLLRDLRHKLHADSAYADIAFVYFLPRAAPVTGAVGMLDYESRFLASSSDGGDDFVLGVRVPITTLCPCSKAISDYGAHNQRGYVDVSLRALAAGHIVWIEEVAELVEACASSPVYPLLKRPDERHVTMQAYDRPAFVEDIARDVSAALRARQDLSWYKVEAVNMESIHNHSAYAVIEEQMPFEVDELPPRLEVASAS
jgi:GTP cyclohydrolase IB